MNITIYIRSSIEDRFREEPDKSKLINELLQQHYGMDGQVNIKENTDGTISPRVPSAPTVVSTDWAEVGAKKQDRGPDPETGWPCCTGKSPCKHWQWDSGKEMYVNTVTGKEREPAI